MHSQIYTNLFYIQYCNNLFNDYRSIILFIDILEELFNKTIYFDRAKSLPLIPYNVFKGENIFKKCCCNLLKYYKLIKSWNDLQKIANHDTKHRNAKGVYYAFIDAMIKIKDIAAHKMSSYPPRLLQKYNKINDCDYNNHEHNDYECIEICCSHNHEYDGDNDINMYNTQKLINNNKNNINQSSMQIIHVHDNNTNYINHIKNHGVWKQQYETNPAMNITPTSRIYTENNNNK